MLVKKVCLLLIIAVIGICQVGFGETWYLKDGEFEALNSASGGKFLRDISNVKGLATSGQCKEFKKAVEKLRADYPEISGSDFDAFIKAEVYFCKHKYTKAIRSYDAFMEEYPQSYLYDAALEREYQIGVAYLNGEKKRVMGIFKAKGYASGEKIMEKLSDREGDSPIAINAIKEVAASYEKREMYNDAYMQWSYISSRWPFGDVSRESLLSMGRCKHAAYKGPKYDDSSLLSARSYYEKYIMRYPESHGEYKLEEKVAEITEQLAYKQFVIGQYYHRTGYRPAADFYYEMILEKWPNSTAAEMIRRINDN